MSFLMPKPPKIPDPIPPVTRDDAIDQQRADSARLMRRGAGANMITGPTGAEARSPGARVLLGQG